MTSVWPPIRETPMSLQASEIWRKTFSIWGLWHVLGYEEGGEEPSGLGARGGDVIGVDVDRVPAYLVGGEGDGVGLGHQDPSSDMEMTAASSPIPGPMRTVGR